MRRARRGRHTLLLVWRDEGGGRGDARSPTVSIPLPTLPSFSLFLHSSHHAPTRVPCPVDPTHTIAPSKLAKHVKACTKAVAARAAAARPFYVPGVNRRGGVQRPSASAPAAAVTGVPAPLPTPAAARRAAAAALGPESLNDLIDRLLAAADALDAPWPLPPGPSQPAAEAGAVGAVGLTAAARHASQNAAIVACAAGFGLFGGGAEGEASLALVELGAGRGALGAAAAASLPSAALALVDRRPYRAKADRHLRDRRLVRVTADIADVECGSLVGWAFNESSGGGRAAGTGVGAGAGEQGRASPPPPPPAITRWVVLGKHLCGGATDLALRTVVAARGRAAASAPPAGLAVATCCHHGSTWPDFCGRASFLGAGFSEDEFGLVAQFAAWALCGHGRPKGGARSAGAAASSSSEGDEDGGGCGGGGGAAAAPWQTAIPLPRRHAAGAAAKRVLDACRLAWLRERVGASNAAAVAYVPASVCGENRLLLARVE